jgi:hypothetical protein
MTYLEVVGQVILATPRRTEETLLLIVRGRTRGVRRWRLGVVIIGLVLRSALVFGVGGHGVFLAAAAAACRVRVGCLAMRRQEGGCRVEVG